MKANGKTDAAGRRERRAFSAEFKSEAVRLVAERRALGVSLAQVAREYRTALAAYGMVASMSRKGDCYDNAVAESFFATLEFELIMKHDWEAKDEARHAIFRYIETWYNRKRRHSTLGYISPAQYEQELQQAA